MSWGSFLIYRVGDRCQVSGSGPSWNRKEKVLTPHEIRTFPLSRGDRRLPVAKDRSNPARCCSVLFDGFVQNTTETQQCVPVGYRILLDLIHLGQLREPA
jgi:hypothetical protein